LVKSMSVSLLASYAGHAGFPGTSGLPLAANATQYACMV
jgi:hypothetical protein